MKNTTIIGIYGKEGSGKSVCARSIISYCEFNHIRCKRLAFARILKEVTNILFGWDIDRMSHDRAYKEGNDDIFNINRRSSIVDLGQGLKNIFNIPDLFVNIIKKEIDDNKDKYDIFVIDDVRFINEYELIKSYDGVLIKINNKVDIPTKRTVGDLLNLPESFTIENDSAKGITFMNEQVELLLTKIGKKYEEI